MVLGEAAGKVLLAGFPEEIELALVDSVFDPPVARIERLGKLLARFGAEDAVGRTVAGCKRRASARLRVSHFFESWDHRAGVFASDVSSCGFGLCRR